MTANQKPKTGDFEKALKNLDEEANVLTELSKNLTESWKNKSDRHWVPEFMLQRMKEIEERFKQIRSLIRVERGSTGETATIPSAYQTHQERIKQLETNNETLLQNLQMREKGLTNLKQGKILPEVQSSLQVDKQEKKPVSTFKVPKGEEVLNLPESSFMKRMMDLESTFRKEKADLKSENRKLLEKINTLETRIQELENEKSQLNESLQVDKQGKKPFTTFKLSNGEEVLNSPQSVFVKKMMDLESQFENEKADLKSENGKLLEKIDTLETRIQELEKDNNVLSERLSKNPGNMLVENNPATIDLSDPNRPTKLAEYFSELYDNEWTDAFEALKTAGYDEITAINTLRLTLENVLHFCEIKAELLLIKASDAVNLLFKEYQQSILDMALIMGKHLRPEQSSLDDIKLQHMWNPKTEKGSQKSRSENMNEIEIIKVEAENELKTLRKKTASAMVPSVQKAYIESYCSDECIDEIKPFILKCLYVGWMMKVQSPPMVFHKCDMKARFDTNLYKEYLTSGQLVNFVVWPALLLHENGPVVCKGVAEGKKIQT